MSEDLTKILKVWASSLISLFYPQSCSLSVPPAILAKYLDSSPPVILEETKGETDLL